MLKTYNALIGIISYMIVAVLAFVKLKTGVPNDIVFVLTEILLYITFLISGISCIREASK